MSATVTAGRLLAQLRLRDGYGWSQGQLSREVEARSGKAIGRSVISMIEIGSMPMPYDSIEPLAEALGDTSGDLMAAWRIDRAKAKSMGDILAMCRVFDATR